MKFMELCKLSKGEAMKWIAFAKVRDLKEVLKGEGIRVSKMRKIEMVDMLCRMMDNIDSSSIVIDIDTEIDKKITTAKQMNEMFSALFNYPKKDDAELTANEIEGMQKSLQYNAKEIDKIIKHKKELDAINELLKDSNIRVKSEYFVEKNGSISEYTYICGGDNYFDISYLNLEVRDFIWLDKGIIPTWLDMETLDELNLKSDAIYYSYDSEFYELNPMVEDIVNFDCSSDEIERQLLEKYNPKFGGDNYEYVNIKFDDLKNVEISMSTDSLLDMLNGEVNIYRYRISYEKLVAQKSKYESGVRYIDVAYKAVLDE